MAVVYKYTMATLKPWHVIILECFLGVCIMVGSVWYVRHGMKGANDRIAVLEKQMQTDPPVLNISGNATVYIVRGPKGGYEMVIDDSQQGGRPNANIANPKP